MHEQSRNYHNVRKYCLIHEQVIWLAGSTSSRPAGNIYKYIHIYTHVYVYIHIYMYRYIYVYLYHIIHNMYSMYEVYVSYEHVYIGTAGPASRQFGSGRLSKFLVANGCNLLFPRPGRTASLSWWMAPTASI